MSVMADDAIAGGAERGSLDTATPTLFNSHESEALPRADWPQPFWSRAREWQRRCAGGPRESVPSAARLDEHERRPPVPPRLGQNDPGQPIAPPELRTGGVAPHRIELLAEREGTEDQSVKSAATN